MNTQPDFAGRLARFRRELQAHDLAGGLVSCPEHVYYLCGVAESALPVFLVVGLWEACLVLPAHAATAAFEGQQIGYVALPMAQVHVMPENAALALATGLETAGLSGQAVGIESAHLPHVYAAQVGAVSRISGDITPHLARLRFCKDAFEIAQLRANQRVNDSAFAAARQMIQPGLDELTLYNALYTVMAAHSGAPFCWQGCLGGGARSALPNPQPSDYRLQHGDLLLLDIFSRMHGYYSDSTRTFVVGPATDSQRALHAILEEALDAGAQMLRPGVRACEVDAAVRGVVTRAGYGESFTHHVGHGIGLSQQESPYLVPGDPTPLQAGCVIALEPGIYSPGLGGMRLENVYLVTENGPEVLTDTPATLLETTTSP